MKALIREKGETVTENMGIPGINWDTGYPLTASGWAGGPYTLVNDYVQTPDEDFAEAPEPEIVTEPAPAESEETVTIDGKEYTREELLALLNQKTIKYAEPLTYPDERANAETQPREP